MGCTTCSGNPNTWCTQCMPAEDTWVAPVDKLPDVFMGDRDHMYLLPNGDLFILSPDRTRWIKVNGQGGGVTYDDTAVINRLKALEGKTDNFISTVGVSRNGNRVKLTYTLVDGTIKEVEFEDKDTVALAYDDSALKARVKALEDKPVTPTGVNTFFAKGDISGNGTSQNVRVTKDKLVNADTIKVGDTVVDRYWNKDLYNIGMFKVASVNGNDVVLNGVNDLTYRHPKQSLTLSDRVLSISEGNSVTLPSDNQTLTLAGRTLSISGGNSVTLPDDTLDGGDNLICNSAFPENTNGWGNFQPEQQQPNLRVSKHQFYYNNTENLFLLSNGTRNEVVTACGRFKTKRNTNYTMNLCWFASGNITGVSLSFLGKKTGETADYTKVVTIVELPNTPSASNLVKSSYTFNVGECDEGYIRIYNKGTSNSDTAILFFGEVDVYEGTSPRAYNSSVKCALASLSSKEDNDKQTLSFNEGNRNLSISNGNIVVLPDYLKKDDAYKTFPTYAKLQDDITKNIKDKHVDLGLDKLIEDKLQNGQNPYVTKGDVPALSGANFFVAKGDIPGTKATTINKNTVYNSDTIKVGDTVRDRFLERTTGVLEYSYWKVTAVTDNTISVEPLGSERDITIGQSNQTLTLNGNNLSISGGNSVNLPQYVSLQEFNTLKNEYNQLKGAFTALLQNLKNSGAWNQTGNTIFEGSLRPDRNIATGNINLFGGTVDGSAFIRTNNGKTENDLAGGIN